MTIAPPPADPSADPSEAQRIRCSPLVRAAGLSPAGTAGSPSGFVLVDWPLPWPRDVGEIEELTEATKLAGTEGLRLQATVPLEGTPPRVALYRAADQASGFAGYEGREVDAAAGGAGVTAAVADLLAGGGRPIAGGEVLVCTHGRRDACCGSFGTVLAQSLMTDEVEATLGRTVRRTSHTGGHRFAPTSIVLPEGTLWAFVDYPLLARVTSASGPIEDLPSRYRGCAGLGSPQLQALEARVLAEVGWPLLVAARHGTELGEGRYRLTATWDHGEPTRSEWEATVGKGREIALPDCGAPAGAPANKTAYQWDVTDLRRVA